MASRTEEHAKSAADKYKIPRVYHGDGWKEMLNNENLDVLSICTPNYLHTPNILNALKNDIHILCEKPICISRKELQIVETELKKKDLIFFTAFHKRYIGIFPLIKKIIENQVLGKIISARYYFAHLGPYTSHNALSKERWFFDSEKAGGGVFLDLGVHSIDVFRFLIGEYENVEGVSFSTSCIQMKDEDTCNVLFRFENDALGIITTSWCNHPTEFIEIYGTKGTIFIDLIAEKPFCFLPHELKENIFIKEADNYKRPEETLHHLLIDHFIECVLENRQASPDFNDGKIAVEFVFDAYSLKKN